MSVHAYGILHIHTRVFSECFARVCERAHAPISLYTLVCEFVYVCICVCMCSVGRNRRNVSAGFTSKRKIDKEKVGPARIGISLEV